MNRGGRSVVRTANGRGIGIASVRRNIRTGLNSDNSGRHRRRARGRRPVIACGCGRHGAGCRRLIRCVVRRTSCGRPVIACICSRVGARRHRNVRRIVRRARGRRITIAGSRRQVIRAGLHRDVCLCDRGASNGQKKIAGLTSLWRTRSNRHIARIGRRRVYAGYRPTRRARSDRRRQLCRRVTLKHLTHGLQDLHRRLPILNRTRQVLHRALAVLPRIGRDLCRGAQILCRTRENLCRGFLVLRRLNPGLRRCLVYLCPSSCNS